MDNDDDRSDRFVVCYQIDSACADLFAIFYCKSNGLAISVFDLSQKTCARDRTGDPLLLAAGSNERRSEQQIRRRIRSGEFGFDSRRRSVGM